MKRKDWMIVLAVLAAIIGGYYITTLSVVGAVGGVEIKLLKTSEAAFKLVLENTGITSATSYSVVVGLMGQGSPGEGGVIKPIEIFVDDVKITPTSTSPSLTNICSSATIGPTEPIGTQRILLSFSIPNPSPGTHILKVCYGASADTIPPAGGPDCGNPRGTECKTLTFTNVVTPPIPPTPSIVDFWNSIKSFIDGILSWLHGLLPFAIATTSTPVNIPYSATISLTGIPPTDSDYSDGFVSETTCAGFIIDSSGAYKYQGTPTALASGVASYSTAVSFTPTVAGKYAQGIACVGRNSTYNYGIQNWGSWTSPVVVASDRGDITVTGPGTPPTPPAIDYWSSITSFINGIFCWLRALLGQGTC